MMRARLSLTLCLCLSTAAVFIMEAQDFTEFQRLVAQSPNGEGAEEHFGVSVSVHDSIAIVGADKYLDENTCAEAGGTFVLYRNAGGIDNWGIVAVLTASDAQQLDRFGGSVSISGDVAIVGAWGDDDGGSNAGAAYVFRKDQGGVDNWGQVKKLIASDAKEGDAFGESVSLSGDLAIVGAQGESEGGSAAGAAYVFQKGWGGANQWGQVKKLKASDGDELDFFGGVCISGDVIVVGAHGDDEGGSGAGAAYVFERDVGGVDNWGQVKKLTALDAEAGDAFGESVSLSGDLVIVGAYGDDDDGLFSGAAYVFERTQGGVDNWGQVKKLTASDAGTIHFFGGDVSICGEVVIVGANGEAGGIGAAYVFQKDQGGGNNWGQVKRLGASDATANDAFGISVSIGDDVALIGAWLADGVDTSSGAAYLFQKDEEGIDQWGQKQKRISSDFFLFPPFCDSGLDHYFGYSVSHSGDVAIVGAWGYNEGENSDVGAAYVYGREEGACDAWTLLKKLSASDAQQYGRFGWSVQISGDVVIVGANGEASNTGAAYIFEKDEGGLDNWGQVKKLSASDAEQYDQFGWSVFMSGDLAIVGALVEGVGGAAYIFQKDQGGFNNWGQVKKLSASDAEDGSSFGSDVSLLGDVAIVGADADFYGFAGTGAAYVFEKDEGGINNWGEVKKLSASDAKVGDAFGESVSFSGDMIIIGASHDNFYNAAGAAYIFRKDEGGLNNWGQVRMLTASDTALGDFFGSDVSINGDVAIVGAHAEYGIGAAYVFQKDQGGLDHWGKVKKLTASDAEASDHFGKSVSLSGDLAIVGAYGFDHGFSNAGAAYVFSNPLVFGFESCQETIFITETFLANDPHQTGFHAAVDLSASGLITAQESLTFLAGNTIALLPNFEIEVGAQLLISIEACVQE